MNKNAKMRWPSIGKCTVPSDNTTGKEKKKNKWDISREELNKAIDIYESEGGTTTQIILEYEEEFTPMGSIAGIIDDIGGAQNVRTRFFHHVVGFDPFKG